MIKYLIDEFEFDEMKEIRVVFMNEEVKNYIEKYPAEVIKLYGALRQIIYDNAIGELTEQLWAKIPSYYVGDSFVRLIPFKDHINVEAKAVMDHAEELCGYKITTKGMLQLYVGQEIPDEVLKKVFSQTLGSKEIQLSLRDEEWPFEYTDHDRNIVRAIVYDDEGYFYFVRADRDDDFGRAVVIETSGGGVENREDLCGAIKRELREELGAEVDIICKIGVVSDYYNLIHRHNINNFYLCKITAFGDKNLTQDEMNYFHLSTLKLTYEEALCEYEKNRNSMLGRIIRNRELPILIRAKELLERQGEK